jgi:predicted TIM-barrel fold metal-dependent hydrolase
VDTSDELRLRDWRPVSQVRAPVTPVERPAVPVVDVHNHLGRWLTPDGQWMIEDVGALLAVMDACDVATVVNLDGRWGNELTENLARYDHRHAGRFVTFAHLDWAAAFARRRADDVVRELVSQVDDAVARGARGFKVWKDLGLSVRDADRRLVMPDDERLLPAFEAIGAHGVPVLIHTADPVAFFQPLDARNERLDELAAMPDWWFGSPGLPSFDQLIEALERLVTATPGTTYIGAHLGCHAEDVDAVGHMLDRCPNFHVDIGGRLGELGRVPRGFRRLVQAHPDRVLFGTDAYPVTADDYRTAFRFCETDDEAFGYAPGHGTATGEVPPQGRWDISGAALPSEVLPDFYAGNARRLLLLSPAP